MVLFDFVVKPAKHVGHNGDIMHRGCRQNGDIYKHTHTRIIIYIYISYIYIYIYTYICNYGYWVIAEVENAWLRFKTWIKIDGSVFGWD